MLKKTTLMHAEKYNYGAVQLIPNAQWKFVPWCAIGVGSKQGTHHAVHYFRYEAHNGRVDAQT